MTDKPMTVGDLVKKLMVFDQSILIFSWDCELNELRPDIEIGKIDNCVAIKSGCLTDFEEMKEFHWSVNNEENKPVSVRKIP